MHFTVAIIGAGPAGSSAAMTLASQNIDVCLIDKKEFPREKLCGGLLTKRSKKIFEQVFVEKWEDVVWSRAHGVRFFNQNRFLSKVSHYSTLYFTQRIHFDHYLLERSIDQGATALLGSKVRDIDLEHNKVILKNNDIITYDYLIGADGVHSIVAKKLFGKSYDNNKIGFALECEIPFSDTVKKIDVPEIYFNTIKWGYAWVFPKKETLTVGMGGIQHCNKEMRKTFEAFLLRRFSQLPDIIIKGNHIPFGEYRKKALFGNTLLCGDAAGLVETITGEGIAFAMQSGHNAAQCITAKIDDPSLNMEAFHNKLYQEITSTLKISNILRYLIFSKFVNKVFMGALSKSGTIGKQHLDLMADTISYGEYLKNILKKIVLYPFVFLRRR